MNESLPEITHILKQLINTTERLLQLDVEDETHLEAVAAVQEVQLQLREKLQICWTPVALQNNEIRRLGKQAIELEDQLLKRFKAFRQEASEQLSRIREGSRAKHVYQSPYSQSEGYFFDSRK